MIWIPWFWKVTVPGFGRGFLPRLTGSFTGTGKDLALTTGIGFASFLASSGFGNLARIWTKDVNEIFDQRSTAAFKYSFSHLPVHSLDNFFLESLNEKLGGSSNLKIRTNIVNPLIVQRGSESGFRSKIRIHLNTLGGLSWSNGQFRSLELQGS